MEYIICNLTQVAMKTWKPVWQTGLIRQSIGIQADRNEKGRMGGKSGGEGGMPVAVRRDGWKEGRRSGRRARGGNGSAHMFRCTLKDQ